MLINVAFPLLNQISVEEIQQTRLERIRKTCKLTKLQEQWKRRKKVYWWGRSTNFNKWNLTVCRIAKCGSTLWREVLLPIHQRSKSLPKNPPSKTYRAMFVRHPLLRVYSAYNDKIVGMQTYYINYIRSRISKQRYKKGDKRPSCLNDVTFEEFLQVVLGELKNGRSSDVHWTPYWQNCKMCAIKYNFVGKLETFRTDIKQISEFTQKSGNFSINKTHIVKNYALDKCRMMHFKELTPRSVLGTKFPCNSVKIMLPRKLESMKNKGLTEEFGFTYEAFKDLPKTKWMTKCVKLVESANKDPEKKAKVSKLSKEMRIKAFSKLDKNILKALIKAYKIDLKMFDYDPQTVFQ